MNVDELARSVWRDIPEPGDAARCAARERLLDAMAREPRWRPSRGAVGAALTVATVVLSAVALVALLPRGEPRTAPAGVDTGGAVPLMPAAGDPAGSGAATVTGGTAVQRDIARAALRGLGDPPAVTAVTFTDRAVEIAGPDTPPPGRYDAEWLRSVLAWELTAPGHPAPGPVRRRMAALGAGVGAHRAPRPCRAHPDTGAATGR